MAAKSRNKNLFLQILQRLQIDIQKTPSSPSPPCGQVENKHTSTVHVIKLPKQQSNLHIKILLYLHD